MTGTVRLRRTLKPAAVPHKNICRKEVPTAKPKRASSKGRKKIIDNCGIINDIITGM